MKLTRMLWGFLVLALFALGVQAQSSSANRLGAPSGALTPGKVQGNLEDDVITGGVLVKFQVPLAQPGYGTGPGGAQSLRAFAQDLRHLRQAATGIRIDLSAIAAAAARIADRELKNADDRLLLRVASPAHGWVLIDVRRFVSGVEVHVRSFQELGAPSGGLTPGGKSTSAGLMPRLPRPVMDLR